MNDYGFFVAGKIFSMATNVLEAIQNLESALKERGIEVPKEYDNSRKGGYLALYQENELIETGELIMLGKIGVVDPKKDEEYGTKNQKYIQFAKTKCEYLIQHLDHESNHPAITSDQTSFAIKGGLTINKSLVIGFSGRSQCEDELLVVVTTMLSKTLLDEDSLGGDGPLVKVEDIKNNPFLEKEILDVVLYLTGYVK